MWVPVCVRVRVRACVCAFPRDCACERVNLIIVFALLYVGFFHGMSLSTLMGVLTPVTMEGVHTSSNVLCP